MKFRELCPTSDGWEDILGCGDAVFLRSINEAAGDTTAYRDPLDESPGIMPAEVGAKVVFHARGNVLHEDGSLGALFLDSAKGVGCIEEAICKASGPSPAPPLVVSLGCDDDHPLVPPGLMLALKRLRAGEVCQSRQSLLLVGD